MAGKTLKTKYVPVEERPEFLALWDSLPTDQGELGRILLDARAAFHDAVLAGHVDQLESIGLRFKAAMYRMHGEEKGCLVVDSAPQLFLTQHDPRPGRVPKWGEAGEFLLEVEGMRVRVQLDRYLLDYAQTGSLNVVDIDKPFLSETGFRSFYIAPGDSVGLTVDQAVKQAILAVMDERGKDRMVMVEPNAYARRAWKGNPQWLADALAGVARDGQLAMFGDHPPEKKPLSGAERQKRRRDKLRELKEKEGLKPVMLTERERVILQAALALDNASRPLPGPDEQCRQALLEKLAPDSGEPIRCEPPSLLNLAPGQPQLDRVWNRLPTDFSRAATTIGLLRLRDSQHAELLRAVELLRHRLRVAGLNDELDRWYWNENPAKDYRPISPPEHLERVCCEMTNRWEDEKQ